MGRFEIVPGRLKIAVGRCGLLWDRCGSLWIVVGRCGSLWVVPGFSDYDSKLQPIKITQFFVTARNTRKLKNKRQFLTPKKNTKGMRSGI